MRARQRIVVAAAMAAAIGLILFFVWFLQRPKETMEGTLVFGGTCMEQTTEEG